MDVQDQASEGLNKVADLIKEIKFGMLTTLHADDSLHSRPMTTLQMDSDGCLWFFASDRSWAADDIDEKSRVNIAYARVAKQDYLSVSGNAQIVRDRDKMQALWTPWIKPWFQDGLDDPDLILLKVEIDAADYWEAPGSMVKRLYGLAKGMLTGNTDALGEHGRVQGPH